MLHKSIPTILISLSIVFMTLPASAGGTVSERYEFSNGGSVDGIGTSVVWDPCWDVKEDGDAATTLEDLGLGNSGWVGDAACEPFGGRLNLGGLQGLDVAPETTNIVISIADDAFDSTAFTATTSDRFDGNGDQNTEYFSGCGSAAWAGDALDFMQVWVYSAVLDTDTLELCAGSAGLVTAVYS